MTQRNEAPIPLASPSRRKWVADFGGGTIGSDGGLLLLREADRQIGLLDALDAAIPDPRHPFFIAHPQRTLLAQRVFGIACGYEDLNDHQALREDPLWQAATDHPGPDAAPQLASPPTLCRLENRVTRRSPARIAAVLVDQFIAAHATPRRRNGSSSTSTRPTTRCTGTRNSASSTATTTGTASCRCTCSAAPTCWWPTCGRPTSTGPRTPARS